MPAVPRILVISFSPIHRDARVLRQLSVIRDYGTVTTVGFGEHPEYAHKHVEVPSTLSSLPETPMGVASLVSRHFSSAERRMPATNEALRLLKGQSFDLVIANDARALPLAFRIAAGSPVVADLHEWAPSEQEEILSWRLLVSPFMDYLCKKYLMKCAGVITVSPSIAHLYLEHYGVEPAVVRNTPQYVSLVPSKSTSNTVRLVHSGGAIPGRALETIIDAVQSLDESFSLDLYLVPGRDTSYLDSLKKRAAGNHRITFHDPVSSDQLPKVLNQYDVGVYWLPPTSTNNRLALPNKFFDFIQARLALAIGPTQDMEAIVKEYDLGVISSGFALQDAVDSLRKLDSAQIARFKQNAQSAASTLSFESERRHLAEVIESALP